MVDIVDKKTRSRMMAGISGKDTRPELKVRSWLHTHGFRFRLHVSGLPGKPDLVLPKWKTAIFVNGCFWHHHEGCRNAVMPKSNRQFWYEKINANVARDEKNKKLLESQGWKVFVIWECQVDEPTLVKLVGQLRSI
jgi:DNA mismatch endonuclease (patch repair protein)